MEERAGRVLWVSADMEGLEMSIGGAGGVGMSEVCGWIWYSGGGRCAGSGGSCMVDDSKPVLNSDGVF